MSKLIPSGCTLLNLACSDTGRGAFRKGRIVTLPGGWGSGKSMLSWTVFAATNRDKEFKDYVFYYDDAEAACDFNIGELFGKNIFKRCAEMPHTHTPSRTIQDFRNNMLKLFELDHPFVYVLDSLDSLCTEEELERGSKRISSEKKADQEMKDGYQTEKPKMIGQIFRMINNHIEQTESLLIIIQQTRQKLGVVFGSDTTTSGGNAPNFYSHHRIWLKRAQTIAKRNRKIGNKVNAKLEKNKLTGKVREVSFDIYDSLGIDDIGSCVDFLIEEGVWRKKHLTIEAPQLSLAGKRSTVIKTIEKDNLEDKLIDLVEKSWLEIEEDIKKSLDRKRRF